MGAALEAVRAYGDFHGLSGEDAERLRPGSPFTKIVFRDGVLSVDYEGCYIDVEPFLDEWSAHAARRRGASWTASTRSSGG
jgi:hypothetical protein